MKKKALLELVIATLLTKKVTEDGTVVDADCGCNIIDKDNPIMINGVEFNGIYKDEEGNFNLYNEDCDIDTCLDEGTPHHAVVHLAEILGIDTDQD